MRLDALVFLTNRKLFANSFLSDMAQWYFIPTGNFSPMVSHTAWHRFISSQQETSQKNFSPEG